MKKLASVVLCLLMVAALAVTVFAASGAKFSMTPASKTLERGNQVTLTVKLTNDTAATSYGLKLSYDANVFEIVDGAINENIGAPVATFDATKGFAFMFTGSAKAYSGTVGTVTFKVKDDAAFGTYTITGVASVKNGSTAVTATDCSATITVSCTHSYSSWSNANADAHQKTCSKCGDVQTEAHKWNSGTTTKAATCTAEGVKTYTCSTCKATKTEAIAALGHKEGTGTTTKSATCTEDGVKSYKCTRSGCGQVVRTEAIAALGHKEDAGKVTKPATCKEEGVKTFSCTRTGCGQVVRTEVIPIDENVHKFGNLVYVDETYHKDVCSICNEEVSLTHKWNNGVVTKEATCKEDGVKTFTCSACNGTKTEVIPKHDNHTYDSAEYIDENGHKAICSVCENEVTVDHNWDKGTVTKEPTCLEDGEKTCTCVDCKGTKTEVIVASEEYHVPGEWTVTVQPTYTAAGSRESVCTICEEPIVEELPAIAVPPTGDNSKIMLWSAVMVLSLCGLGATIFLLGDKKRKHS